jgi:hypothetical protein
MKHPRTFLRATLSILFITGWIIVFVACNSEEDAWRRVERENSPEARLAYLQKYPNGQRAMEVRAAQEEFEYDQARESESILELRKFIEKYPKNELVESARHEIERNLYKAATKSKNIKKLIEFIKEFPSSYYAEEACELLVKLRRERHIANLIADGAVVVEARGAGIQAVKLKITPKKSGIRTAYIPAGTYFENSNKNAQNMVSVKPIETTISDKTVELEIPVACANRPLAIPGSGNTFTIKPSPAQEELEKLSIALELASDRGEDIPYAARQAAVWIVTDNADYNDMGILQTSSSFNGVAMGGGRTIRESSALLGMKLCDEAGVLRGKRVEKDCFLLFHGLAFKDKNHLDWVWEQLKSEGFPGETPAEMIFSLLEEYLNEQELGTLLDLSVHFKAEGAIHALERFLWRDFPPSQVNSEAAKRLRAKAFNVLRQVDNKNSLPIIAYILETPQAPARNQAIEAARHASFEMKKDPALAERAANSFIEILERAEDIHLRVTAIQALGVLQSQRAVNPICAAMLEQEKARHLRDAAVQALGEIGDPQAIPALRSVLSRVELPYERNQLEKVIAKLEEKR